MRLPIHRINLIHAPFMWLLHECNGNSVELTRLSGSLKPRLSVPDFVSQLWGKFWAVVKAESLAYTINNTIVVL